ncbi:PH and SEC7 domain-containing protein 4 [Larimichthys crocea]|uniref:PH and SEC7 domain-containing protein 4 n=1 Tax=Larimichthys crocea TaxID=215358 RepID=UPI000F5F8C8B|nr:PH and SEC7 domain-containing protein 4 [Larimichthys crocea]XP_027137871.1 PH and SEC7 domain-containing protein 4 [Larimichthys crocea]XP_027137872.1 PH and SEC7 domain-containing protein 4 [Larimichthys crocea]
MLMEEENVCTSLPDITDSVLQQPLQDSWTPLEHQYINGEQQAIVWGETEVQINQAHETDQLSLSPKAGRETPEEAEQWEQIIWPVHPMTCTSPPLSFATVQWDMPDLSAETFPLMTDSSLANELNSRGGTSLGTTSPSLHGRQEVNEELLTQEDGEEEDGFDSGLLNSDLEWTGSTFKPCDAANVQEPAAQEKEDSTHELLDSNNELSLRTDSDEERGHSADSDPVVVDLIDILKEIEGSECEVDNFVHINLEEEQEEPGVLLTGQEDSEEEQSTTNAIETEEEKEEGAEVEEEGTEEGDEDQTASCLVDVEVPAEQLQTDNTGLTSNPDKLIDLQQSELLEERRCSGSEEDIEVLERLHEEPAGQTEEPEMCTDVDQKVDPEVSEAADDDNKEPPIQAAERRENSQEQLELTKKLEEISLDCDQTSSQELSPEPEHFEQLEMTEEPVQIQAQVPEQVEMTEEPVQIQAEVSHQAEERHSEDQLGEALEPQAEVTEESTQPENADPPEESTPSEQTVCVEAEDPGVAEQQEQTEPPEQNEQTADSSQPTLSEQPVLPEETDEPQITEQLSAETEVAQQTAEINQVDKQAETPHQAEDVAGSGDGSVQTVVANGEQPKPPETTSPLINGGEVEREMARSLAERLYKLDGIPRVDVVKHLDKDNDYSRAVGEEYLKFFDFTGQPLDHALRSFLKVVVLIGETQERERVLQHFACRFQQCNPDSFSSSGSVLALTCALMLLNTDLHGQNVGKSMSSSKFVSNLDGMNEGENFNKDLLKSLYNSIKSEPLEWAVDEEELKNTVLADEDAADDAPLRSKANPFQDVPHDKTASVVKEGFLQRKLHADIDGKRTPWGKRSWKTFYGVLRGMVLYLQKDDRKDQPTNEEVVSVHHSLAEQAAEYTKKPHVFRLQTADWRVFLFQASSKVEMNSWISRINLVSALHSSPPFPAAVGSQRRFFRPILPASQSAHTLERQLQSHTGMLESFKADLSYLQQNLPEGKKAKAKELEEHRVRAEYLQHEMCRYEIYIQVLESWKSVKNTGDGMLSIADLNQFDKAVCADSVGEEDEDEGLKKSHSSPSLELELLPPTVIKVRRNISERRTYRRTIIPRWNKEA